MVAERHEVGVTEGGFPRSQFWLPGETSPRQPIGPADPTWASSGRVDCPQASAEEGGKPPAACCHGPCFQGPASVSLETSTTEATSCSLWKLKTRTPAGPVLRASNSSEVRERVCDWRGVPPAAVYLPEGGVDMQGFRAPATGSTGEHKRRTHRGRGLPTLQAEHLG